MEDKRDSARVTGVPRATVKEGMELRGKSELNNTTIDSRRNCRNNNVWLAKETDVLANFEVDKNLFRPKTFHGLESIVRGF